MPSRIFWTMKLRLNAAFWYAAIIVVLTLGGSHVVHRLAGFTFPVPWEDETQFAFPGLSFSESWTLFTPNLNAERTINMMLPGYPVFLGFLFKAVSFSYEALRWSSWTLTMMAYVGLVVLLRRLRTWWAGLPLLSLFILGVPFVVAGNVARPEALCLALAVWGFVALEGRRPWMAMAIHGVAGLVHPNGIYFLASSALWSAMALRPELRRPRRADVVVACLGLLCGSACLLYLFLQGPQVLKDLEHSHVVMWKGWAVFFGRPYFLYSAGIGVLMLLLWLALIRRKRAEVNTLALLALCCLAIKPIRGEMWYDVYRSVAVAGLGLLLVEFLESTPMLQGRLWLRRSAAVAGVLAALWFGREEGCVEGPRGYPHDMVWGWGMKMSDGVPYQTPADYARVCDVLRQLPRGNRDFHVTFFPLSESLFYYPELGRTMVLYHPYFASRKPDAVIRHHSRYFPAWAARGAPPRWQRWGFEEGPAFHARDGTESWTLGRRMENGAAAPPGP